MANTRSPAALSRYPWCSAGEEREQGPLCCPCTQQGSGGLFLGGQPWWHCPSPSPCLPNCRSSARKEHPQRQRQPRQAAQIHTNYWHCGLFTLTPCRASLRGKKNKKSQFLCLGKRDFFFFFARFNASDPNPEFVGLEVIIKGVSTCQSP